MESKRQMIEVYAIDVGNGFTKRTKDGINVQIEPSVFVETRMQVDGKFKGIAIDQGTHKHFGTDAILSGYTIQMALGEQDSRRYESQAYKELLFGMIQKDCLADETIIHTLVLGLPNHHFKQYKTDIESMFSKRTVSFQIGYKQQILRIERVIVIPQPFGTYIYAAKGEEKTLIIDGGHGTIDTSYFANSELVQDFSTSDGMKKAYEEILTYVKHKFPDADYKLIEMSEVLSNGVKYRGERYQISEDTYVQNVLDRHFNQVYESLIVNYGSFVNFDHVIWSGGMALMHAKRIIAKKEPHFDIIIEPQIANVLGFYELGVVIDD